MVLALKTDNPVAEIYLVSSTGHVQAEKQWEAGRKLSSELLGELKSLLASQNADWNDLASIIVFQGPGSFTGLRIGITIANTIAYAQNVPIVGARTDEWLKSGISKLEGGENDVQVLPHYGAEANITRPGANRSA